MARRGPTVLVMEAGGKAALPVIESLARGGLRVAAGADHWLNSGFFSRHCHERHRYPSPRHRPREHQRWLLDFVARRRIEMLFPVGHYGAAAVSEIQDQIRRHTLLELPPHEVFCAAHSKTATMEAALAAGVPIPGTWFPSRQPGGVEQVLPRIDSWPVLVKPALGVGARGIVWCHDADELRRRFAEVQARFGESFVQDFVPGGEQYKVDMLVDRQQRRLAGIVYGKTRMYPPDGGSSVLNYSADREDIMELAERMLAHLGWVGFCDFDFVHDPRDGRAKLIEINPRFPESFRMGTSVGIDFPMMLYRLAHGERVEPVLDYPKNRFLRFLPGDLLWFLRVDGRRRRDTWPGWFRFFDRDTSYQVLSLRDPGPLVGYLAENAATLLDPRLLLERLRLDSGRGRPGEPPDGQR